METDASSKPGLLDELLAGKPLELVGRELGLSPARLVAALGEAGFVLAPEEVDSELDILERFVVSHLRLRSFLGRSGGVGLRLCFFARRDHVVSRIDAFE